MRVSGGIGMIMLLASGILPDLAAVEALSSELPSTSCTWVWAIALHVAMFKLAAVVVWDVSFIPLLATVEASTIVTTSVAGITLASTKTTTKTIILASAKAITKASTEARHCVRIEVSLDKLLKDCAKRLVDLRMT